MRKQQERRSGRQWLVAVLAVALGLTVAGCSASVASNHEHEWEAATCETPRVCKTCGETDGEPLGHTWQEATCLAPKTCTVCGKTEGKKSEDHVWSEATCTEREKCVLCGRVNFHTEPLGHDWIAPTLEAPYTCARCGEQQGEPLKLSAFNRGHNGKWEAHPTKEQYVGMSASSAAWKAISAATGELVAPDGNGTTQGTVKLDFISGKWTYSTTIAHTTGANGCSFKDVTCDSSIGAAAKLLLQALAMLPDAALTGDGIDATYGGDYFYINNAEAERCLIRGGYWSYGGAGVFSSGLGYPRSLADGGLGGRSAFYE